MCECGFELASLAHSHEDLHDVLSSSTHRPQCNVPVSSASTKYFWSTHRPVRQKCWASSLSSFVKVFAEVRRLCVHDTAVV